MKVNNRFTKLIQLQNYIATQKMADKPSAPSYSIGGIKKSGLVKDNGLPGPGAYQTISYIKPNNSHDKLSKGKRFGQYDTVVPGPGTYALKLAASHIPTALVLSRSKQQKHDTVPGPGSYEPDFHKIVKHNSSYKIGKQQKQIDYSKSVKFVPGPGQYQTAKSTLGGLNQAVGFGPERKIQLGINPKTPGPGQYNQAGYYNGSVATQPNVVFSKSNRSQSTNVLVPGPGSYLLKTELEQSLQKSKGYKMGEKIEVKEHSEKFIPGPGAYNASSPNLTKKATPSFSLGKEPKLKIQNFRQIMSKPGPLKYDNKITALEHRSVVIGKDKRKGLGTESNVPGPGTYQYKTLVNSTQTYSVPKSQRKTLADEKKVPGPFQYNPKGIFNTQYQSIGIGSDRRRTFEIKQEVPGPGKYLQQQKKTSGGFNFGKQKRDHDYKKAAPGPGQYQISSTISNLPTYAKK